MIRATLRDLAVASMVVVAVAAWAGEAQAGWWHSCGSSGGCWGSYGSWGSYGGWFGRHHRRHYVSWHGSHGSWGSYGSYGSYGSGGGVYYSPAVPQRQESQPAAPSDLPPAPENGQEASRRASHALLAVSVPQDAKVFINGVATTSTGTRRQYISRGLVSGYQYTYEVRAEAVRDGRKVEQKKTVKVQAGGRANLAFQLEAPPALATTLTLHVPEDATVSLAGSQTSASGPVRVFRTTALQDGKSWNKYAIQVSVNREGQTLTKEETIELKAGDKRTLRFNFDEPKIADAR